MFRRRARVALLATILLSALLGSTMASAAPPTPPDQLWSGQAAVTKLGSRLPAVATANGLSTAELRNHLLTDPTLYIDSRDTLLYVEPARTTDVVGPEAVATPFDPSIPTTDAFLLNSKPGANRVVYLDFDGHTLSGTAWNNSTGGDCYAEPYSQDADGTTFTTSERNVIISIWKRVAEDYAPFDVNITTQDPGYAAINRASTSDAQFGARALITKSTSTCPNGLTLWQSVCNANCGGIAYVGVYDYTGTNHDFYQPNITFQNGTSSSGTSAKSITEAASHEIGHNIGLSHDGCIASCGGYYGGHASWSPIMGVGYYTPISQWSKGEYADANNTQDDFAVAGSNGLPLRADDHGNTAGTGTVLTGTSLSAEGIISTATDVDAFRVQVGAGSATFTVNPVPTSPNLDVKLELRNDAGTLVASNDPASGGSGDTSTGMSASITTTLTAGWYTLLVDGVGYGNPLNTGYTDWGSLGYYQLTGTVVAPTGPPTARISATPTTGTTPLTVTFDGTTSTDPDGGTLTYAWDFGDSSGTSTAASPSYTYTAQGTYTVTLTVTDDQSLTGSATTTITVSPPPPTTLTFTTDAHVLDGKNAAKNYGTATSATIRSGASGSNGWYFLQLDTGGTSTMTKAVLRIRMSTARNTTTPLVVKGVSTAWTETGLTWNNRPTPGTQIGSVSVVGSTSTFYEIDITSYVNAQRAASQPVNIAVQAANATSAAVTAITGENTTVANRPQLVLTP